MASLDHPNIVPHYEVGEAQGQLFYSMKLIPGGCLAAHLEKYLSDPIGAARLVATAARAVHHAHQRGILHRDIKPGNILLDEHGQPHVTDFGLARKIEGEAGLTQSGAIVGTPEYMAPEQAMAQKGLTTAADVYALGAVLYALLTGHPPFQGENLLATLRQVAETDPPSPRSLNANVPRDLEAVCLKCLEKVPARRYGSAEALAEDLDRWMAGEPIAARPAGLTERAWRWVRRNPVVAALSAATALVALMGAGAFFWQFRAAVAARQQAEIEEGKAKSEATNARIAETLAAANAESMREALYVSRFNLDVAAFRQNDYERLGHLLEAMRPIDPECDLRGFEWHVLDRLARGYQTVVKLQGGESPVPFTYTDDRRWAMRQEKGAVHVWDTLTGKQARRIPLEAGTIYFCRDTYRGPRWSAVRFQGLGKPAANKVRLLDPATGSSTPVVLAKVSHPVARSQIVLNPSGRLAVAMTVPGPRAFVWEVKSGTVVSELRLPAGLEKHAPLAEWTEDGKFIRLTVSSNALFDPTTGAPAFTDVPTGRFVRFSRDGRRYTYLDRNGRQILVRDVATGQTIATAPLDDELLSHVVAPAASTQSPLDEAAAAGRRFSLSPEGESLLVGNRLFDLTGRRPPRTIHGLNVRNPPDSYVLDSFLGLAYPLGEGVMVPDTPVEGRISERGIVVTSPSGTVTTYQPAEGAWRFVAGSGSHPTEAAVTPHHLVGWRCKPIVSFRPDNGLDPTLIHYDLRTGQHTVVPANAQRAGMIIQPAVSLDGRRVFLQTWPPPYVQEEWHLSQQVSVPRPKGLGLLSLNITGAPTSQATVLGVLGAFMQNRLTPDIQPILMNPQIRVYDLERRAFVFTRTWDGPATTTPGHISDDGKWAFLISAIALETTAHHALHIDSARLVLLLAKPGDMLLGGDMAVFSPDGRWCVGGPSCVLEEGDATRRPTRLFLWDLSTGQQRTSVELAIGGMRATVQALRFHPDSKRLVGLLAAKVESKDSRQVTQRLRLVIWRVAESGTLEVERELDAGEREQTDWEFYFYHHLVFAPDGRSVACLLPGRERSVVRLWDIETGILRHTFATPHRPIANQIYHAFSPDGRRLIAGGKVWDVKTGLELIDLAPALMGGRIAPGNPPVYAFDGEVVRCIFATETGFDVYTFDGRPRP